MLISRKSFIRTGAVAAGILLRPGFGRSITFGEENPFRHGVASGDANEDALIIWSRISVTELTAQTVDWELSTDAEFKSVVQKGIVTTGPEKDFTVKVDVPGLDPAAIFYYRFHYKNHTSTTGVAKTTGWSDSGKRNFAVISCSDYSAGYYNALSGIAARKDLNAVICLGDYIYEGTRRRFDQSAPYKENEYESTHFNRNRNWWLQFFRYRYSLTRMDTDMQAAHAAHVFYTVWDDHEIANNTWKAGAQGHNPERDGSWEDRVSAARQAYAEWMPLRGDADKIYRSVKFGKEAELFFLDTRLEGRDKQVKSAGDPELFRKDRTLLGATQKKWLTDAIAASDCQWKIIASQVIFSEVNISWANTGGLFSDKYTELESALLDYWEGYPVEKDDIMTFIKTRKLTDVLILSASMHCALAFDVTPRPTRYTRTNEEPTYNPTTGSGSIAVEFATPSITSANFDDRSGKMYANLFQNMINKKIPDPVGYNPNPHMKYADLQQHGYFVLQLTKQQAVASYFFTDQLLEKTVRQHKGAVLAVQSGKSRVQRLS